MSTPHPFASAASLLGGWKTITKRVRRFPANTQGRDFVVGDLHGCLEPFEKLLRHVGFRPAIDRVFSVGDLVDRGPFSMACLKLLNMPWFFACRGNHEDLLLAHLDNPFQVKAYDDSWLRPIAPVYADRKKLAGQWLNVLRSLPYVLVVGEGEERFNVVHAEVLEDGRSVTNEMIDSWSFEDPDKAQHRAVWGRALLRTWQRGKPVLRAHHRNMSPTYCGHTILSETSKVAGQIFLDRGAFLVHKTRKSSIHLDEGEDLADTTPSVHGLVLAEPKTGNYWFAGGLKDPVIPLELKIADAI